MYGMQTLHAGGIPMFRGTYLVEFWFCDSHGTGKAVCDGKKMRDASTSTSDLADQATQDIHDPCIWNSNEIDVLRSVFQAARDQNLKLRAEIHETRDQFEKLQEKHKKQCGDEEARSTRLREAAKANKRFTIVVQNMKQQLESAVRQIDGLRAQVRHMEESRKTNMAAIHELRVASDRERIDRKKAELELQRQTQEALRERRIHEENLKLMHDEDIQYLQKTLEELGVELDSEKKAHERTKRGLNHLRQHFSSLPMDDQLSPEGLVKDDQLQKWTY